MSPVTLSFPADASHISLARTVAAAMAARADLPLDQLEDVRLAVDEAVAQAIADATADAVVTCDFTLSGDVLAIRVSCPVRSGAVPARDTFGWTVLTALVEEATASARDGVLTLDLRVVRSIDVDA